MAKKAYSKDMVQVALDSHKWINTPVVYTTLGANFTLLQQDVMLMVSGRLQNYMKQYLDEKRYKDPKNPKPIFTPEQLTKGIGDIRIQLSSLGVGNSHYADVDTALEALRQLWVKTPVFDKKTGKRVGDDWFPVFEKVFVPASNSNAEGESLNYKERADGKELTRKEGYIDVTINHQVAAYVFDMSHGYFNHLERIALFCRSAYTSRVYMLLMAQVSRGQMHPIIPFMELKEYLGMVDRDRNTNEITAMRYEKFSQFRKQVLDVAQKDMVRLAGELKTEITFEYEPLYRGAARRGNPDSVKFHIKRTQLGLAREAKLHRPSSEEKLLNKLVKDYPQLEPQVLKDLFASVTDEHWDDFKTFAYNEVNKAVDRPHRWDGTVESFVVYILKNRIVGYNKPSPTEEPDLFTQAKRDQQGAEWWANCQRDLCAAVDAETAAKTFALLKLERWDAATGTLLLQTTRAVFDAIETDGGSLGRVFFMYVKQHFGGSVRITYRVFDT